MTTLRTVLTTAVLAGALAAPAAALAGAQAGQSAHYLPTLRAPAASPVAIHGGDPHAFLHTGERLHRGQSLMRVRVERPQHLGIRLRFTCPSGAVTGYGYRARTPSRSTAGRSSPSTPSARRSRPRPTSTTTVASPAPSTRTPRAVADNPVRGADSGTAHDDVRDPRPSAPGRPRRRRARPLRRGAPALARAVRPLEPVAAGRRADDLDGQVGRRRSRPRWRRPAARESPTSTATSTSTSCLGDTGAMAGHAPQPVVEAVARRLRRSAGRP